MFQFRDDLENEASLLDLDEFSVHDNLVTVLNFHNTSASCVLPMTPSSVGSGSLSNSADESRIRDQLAEGCESPFRATQTTSLEAQLNEASECGEPISTPKGTRTRKGNGSDSSTIVLSPPPKGTTEPPSPWLQSPRLALARRIVMQKRYRDKQRENRSANESILFSPSKATDNQPSDDSRLTTDPRNNDSSIQLFRLECDNILDHRESDAVDIESIDIQLDIDVKSKECSELEPMATTAIDSGIETMVDNSEKLTDCTMEYKEQPIASTKAVAAEAAAATMHGIVKSSEPKVKQKAVSTVRPKSAIPAPKAVLSRYGVVSQSTTTSSTSSNPFMSKLPQKKSIPSKARPGILSSLLKNNKSSNKPISTTTTAAAASATTTTTTAAASATTATMVAAGTPASQVQSRPANRSSRNSASAPKTRPSVLATVKSHITSRSKTPTAQQSSSATRGRAITPTSLGSMVRSNPTTPTTKPSIVKLPTPGSVGSKTRAFSQVTSKLKSIFRPSTPKSTPTANTSTAVTTPKVSTSAAVKQNENQNTSSAKRSLFKVLTPNKVQKPSATVHTPTPPIPKPSLSQVSSRSASSSSKATAVNRRVPAFTSSKVKQLLSQTTNSSEVIYVSKERLRKSAQAREEETAACVQQETAP